MRPSASSIDSPPARVMVIAAVRLYREGLAQLLAADKNITLVGAGPADQATVDRVVAARPDAVLLDAAIACETTIVQRLSTVVPDTKVVAYGVLDDDQQALRCAEIGVAGFVTGEATGEQLVETILGLSRGEFRCSPRVAALLVRRVSVLARGLRTEAQPQDAQLTPRERSIIPLINEGLSNKQIATRLGIELSTVKNHVHHILAKLNAPRRAQAAARFRRI